MAKDPKQSDDEKKRDEILRRMLETPPKPHKPTGRQDKPAGQKVRASKSTQPKPTGN